MPYPSRLRSRSPKLAAALSALCLASPALAQPADPLAVSAAAIHKRIVVVDSHADIPNDFGQGADDPGLDGAGQVDLPKLERGGVGAVVLAVFVQQGPRTPEKTAEARLIADGKLKAIRDVAAKYPDRVEIALSADDVARIHARGKVAFIVGFLNAYPFGEDLGPLDAYYKAGLRTFGFVHAGNNAFADSSRPSGQPAVEWNGLSPLGKQAVGRLNRLGVVIDVSQLTPAGLKQVLELTRAPVIASHSGIRSIVDATRNLSDEELDLIKANNGVVQVAVFSSYLARPPADYAEKVAALRKASGLPADYHRPADGADTLKPDERATYTKAVAALIPRATVKDLVDSIDYAVKRIGVDHVGIGTDFNHGGGVVGFDNEGQAGAVTLELVRRGYSEADIAKLWGGNFLRVFRETEATARRISLGAAIAAFTP